MPQFPLARAPTLALLYAMTRNSAIALALLFLSTIVADGKSAAQPPTPTQTPVPQCAGDCDGDNQVRIDELTRGVNIALGIQSLGSCPFFDGDSNGTVAVSELVAAVRNALLGCVLPGGRPDLVPLSVREWGCSGGGGGCGALLMEVCIANQGLADAPSFMVDINDRIRDSVGGIDRGRSSCVLIRYVFFGGLDQPIMTIDPDNVVNESNENNNSLRFPNPNPTRCDLVCGDTPQAAATPLPFIR